MKGVRIDKVSGGNDKTGIGDGEGRSAEGSWPS